MRLIGVAQRGRPVRRGRGRRSLRQVDVARQLSPWGPVLQLSAFRRLIRVPVWASSKVGCASKRPAKGRGRVRLLLDAIMQGQRKVQLRGRRTGFILTRTRCPCGFSAAAGNRPRPNWLKTVGRCQLRRLPRLLVVRRCEGGLTSCDRAGSLYCAAARATYRERNALGGRVANGVHRGACWSVLYCRMTNSFRPRSQPFRRAISGKIIS